MNEITHNSYWTQIQSIAKDIAEEIKEYGGDAYDLAHEHVDGHQWIIYYAYNDDVLKFASNPDAWEDCYGPEDIGRLVIESGMNGARTVQAYFAMLEDVNNALHELEVA